MALHRARGSRWASASPCSPDSPRLVGFREQGLPTLAAQAWDRGGVYAHTRTHTCACTHGAPASALAVSRKQSCLREKAERADLYIERCRSFLYGKGSFQLFLLNVDLAVSGVLSPPVETSFLRLGRAVGRSSDLSTSEKTSPFFCFRAQSKDDVAERHF